MEKISEIIKRHCPEGVEKVRLGQIIEYEQPSKYIVKNTDYKESGIPVLTAGQSFILGYTDELTGIFHATKSKPTIIFDDFTTSFHWVDFDFKVKSSAMKMLNVTRNDVSFRYVYYAMREIVYEPVEHSRQWISQYSNFEIPLPPLSIQQEIVRVLDSFTAMITNLETELASRQKQYEHYRNQLLTFDENDNEIEKIAIKDVFDTRNGYTPSTQNSSFWENGVFPWFKMEDIREKGQILSDSNLHITQSAIKGKGLFKANSIILATSATIGEHALIIVEHLSNQRFTNFYPKKDYLDKIDMKYMHYYFYLIDRWCKDHTVQGNFAGVNMSELYNYMIPIPRSIDRQREIVSILDTFEALITNIKQELEARKKQYEYYREKLLTFE